jgi:hypothetical protein
VRHVRMLGLCLVTALAVGAYMTSSALAGPQWVKCEKVGPGHNYTGPNCTKAEKAKPKGTGEYELYKAPEVEEKRVAEGKTKYIPFAGGNVGSGGVLSTRLRACTPKEGEPEHGTSSGQKTRQKCAENGEEEIYGFEGQVITIECESERNTGRVEGKSSVTNVSVTFKGCKFFGSAPCSNTPTEGEIMVNTLKGKLGYVSKSEHKVGLQLEPAVKHGEFARFNCAGIIETVVGVGNKKVGAEYTTSGCSGIACVGTTPEEEKHGGYDGIIGEITPVNQMTTHFTQVFSVNAATDQNEPSSFEGKHIELLEDYAYLPEQPEHATDWSAAGEEVTNENTAEEAGEIKA